ncbi:MAG: (2Fe-2S)-binding protein [Rubrivivax sp.]|jgi:bacterioferritin-associated ferredoxin
MIVCLCHRISDRDIAHAAQIGCASFDELQFELAVATCCGKCHDCARQTFDFHRAQMQASGQAAHQRDAWGPHRVIPVASQPHHHPVPSATT